MSERIYIVESELERLREVVEQHARGRDGAAAQRLAVELDRATVVDAATLPRDVVTIDSRVAFEDARSGATREVVVVHPSAADASARRISVLAPIGAALIGQRQGDAIDWPLPDGRIAEIRIVSVAQPARTGAGTAA
jgi:regulator of nucleoside diphosphate kinase